MASSAELDFGDEVDMQVFEQILEMDEPNDTEFSKSIVFGFLEQAKTTFEKMQDELEKKNLASLSSLGHFLKGSSATLGFNKIKDECEKIQHWGQNKNDTGEAPEDDDEKCLRLIRESLLKAKRAFRDVEALMLQYYRTSV